MRDNTVLTLVGREEPRWTGMRLIQPNTKQTSSQREEIRKSSKRKTVMVTSLLSLPNPAQHLRNRKPGNKNYPWHYDESIRSSEIQWNSRSFISSIIT